MRVARGSVSAEDTFKEQRGKGSTWGMMHVVCFYLCVGDPAAVEAMAEQPSASI